MKIILFNGPPSSGKDLGTSYLDKAYDVFPFSFKTQLKAITLAIYAIPENQWNIWYSDRQEKELPRPELNGLSCRQALIHVSENIIKPAYGYEFFGSVEAKKLLRHKDTTIAAASDAGFDEEVNPLIEAFGAHNINIVQIHRAGCSFDGDSRNWINHPNIPIDNYFTVYNNGTLDEFYDKIANIYHTVMNR